MCLRLLRLALLISFSAGGFGCGGDDDGNGPPEPPDPPGPQEPGLLANTGPRPAYLVHDAASLFWSEAGEAAVRRLAAGAASPTTVAPRFHFPEGIALDGTALLYLEDGPATAGCIAAAGGRRLMRLSSPAAPEELATGQNCGMDRGDLVVGGGHAYWLATSVSPNTYSLRRTPVAGGPTTEVVNSTTPIDGFIIAGGYLYWLENRYPNPTVIMALRRVPLGGGPAETVLQDYATWGDAFAVADDSLFITVAAGAGVDLLVAVPLAGGDSTVLATLNAMPNKLLVDADGLYWIDDQAVRRLPRSGGTPEVVSSDGRAPLDLLLRGADLVWSEATGPAIGETGAILSAPKGGGAAITLVNGGDAPRWLAADASWLYWTEGGPLAQIEGFGRIARAPTTGGEGLTVVSGVSVPSAPIAVNATHLFIADKWRVKRAPRNGGLPESVAAATDAIESLAADATHVYWVQAPFGSLYRAPVDGGPPELIGMPPPMHAGPGGPVHVRGGRVFWMSHFTGIFSVAVGGGSVQPVVAGDAFLSDFVVDDNDVFYTEHDGGRVLRVPRAGGAATPLASPGGSTWRVLAEAGDQLYWIDQTMVQAMPKAGGESRLLSAPVGPSAVDRSALAVGEANIFWTEVLLQGIAVIDR